MSENLVDAPPIYHQIYHSKPLVPTDILKYWLLGSDMKDCFDMGGSYFVFKSQVFLYKTRLLGFYWLFDLGRLIFIPGSRSFFSLRFYPAKLETFPICKDLLTQHSVIADNFKVISSFSEGNFSTFRNKLLISVVQSINPELYSILQKVTSGYGQGQFTSLTIILSFYGRVPHIPPFQNIRTLSFAKICLIELGFFIFNAEIFHKFCTCQSNR